jgi:hypothetical protein
MALSLEESEKFLTPGLSASDRQEMLTELRRIRNASSMRFYSSRKFEQRMQGDALNGAPYIVAKNPPALRTTQVMVLSNSCDISPENQREERPMVTIAPLIRVSKWRDRFIAAGMKVARIDTKLKSLRAQEVTNKLFLPKGQGLDEDSIVPLDHMQSIPTSMLDASNPTTLAVLSQAAHWLLCVKLSIHFSRLQEGVRRPAEAPGP